MARSPYAEGTIFPRGASWVEEDRAYNFSIYSQHADTVVVLLFSEDDLVQPVLEYRLDPRINKPWVVWHCRLSGQEVERARYYAYRIDGPSASGPVSCHAYDPRKVLLDPYAMEVLFPPDFDRAAAQQPGSNLGRAPPGILPRPSGTCTQNADRSPRHLPKDIVIYEMHVRGFTRSPSSEVAFHRRSLRHVGLIVGLVGSAACVWWLSSIDNFTAKENLAVMLACWGAFIGSIPPVFLDR
jgi:isoamylase